MLRYLRSYRAPFLLEPEKGGGSGGGNNNLTIAEQLSQARNDLQTALDKGKTDASEIQRLKDENTRLQQQFDEVSKSAKESKDALATVTKERDEEKKSHGETKDKLTKADGNVTRLEKLCDLKGIDHKNAVAPLDDSKKDGSAYDQYVNAKDPASRRSIYAKHGPEIRAEQNRRSAQQL